MYLGAATCPPGEAFRKDVQDAETEKIISKETDDSAQGVGMNGSSIHLEIEDRHAVDEHVGGLWVFLAATLQVTNFLNVGSNFAGEQHEFVPLSFHFQDPVQFRCRWIKA